MTQRRWMVALAAAAFGAGTAWAHEWVLQGEPERHVSSTAPTEAQALDGFTHVYEVSLVRGQQTVLEIRDTQGCDARIPLRGVQGNAAKLKARVPGDLVRNQVVTIKARNVGTTTAEIPVTGKDVGGAGSCQEQTKNLLVVRVTESAAAAESALGATVRREIARARPALNSDLREHRTALEQVFGTRTQPSFDPGAAWSQSNALTQTQVRDLVTFLHTIDETVATDATSRLEQGMFVPGCEPFGFGAGGFGPMGDLRTGLHGLGDFFTGGLSQNVGRVAERWGDYSMSAPGDDALFFGGQLFAPSIPNGPPPALGPTPPAAPAPLEFHFVSGASWLNAGDPGAGIFVSGGFGLGKGTPNLTFTAPDGGTTILPVTPGPTHDGTLRQFFETTFPLSPSDAGSTFRLDAWYPGESSGPSLFVTVPKLPPELLFPR